MSTTVMPQGSESSNLPATQPRSDLGPLDLSRIAQDLQIRKVQVEAVVHLLDEGNTIPFITRYRKERTGGLDEEILRIIQDRIQQQRSLAERKQTILRTIENQGKLTDELRASILHADNPKRLEDLYLPYKPKKRSLAQAARDRGLDRLAMAIWEADPVAENLEDLLPTLINPEQQLNSTEDILQGVSHILAEVIAESADVRHGVRMVLWDTGRLVTTKSEKVAEGQGQEYRDYFNFSEALRQIPPHRIMAINRGEKDNTLQVKIDWDAATGRRIITERLPLPKKVESSSPPPVTPSETLPSEPISSETPPDAGASPPAINHPPHRGHHHRGHPPLPNRFPDLEKHPHRAFLDVCIDDAMSRLLVPSLEREIRRELKDRAENHAVVVFARNLRSKLLAAPLRGKKVLAIDPAFRTGCKLAVLNEQGDLVADGVIFPHAPQNKKGQARNRLREMLCRHKIQVIAIGNGTACRETEELVSDLLAEFETRRQNPEGFWANLPGASEAPPPVEVPEASITTAAPIESPSTPDSAGINPASEAQASAEVPVSTSESPGQHPADNPANPESSASESAPTPVPSLGEEAGAPANSQADSTPVVPESSEPLPEPITDLAYVIVNEAGASVYSASPVGREEFPQFDATLRGTISIGRRLQDPLSELVKIDPQHVGVGLYQHDVSPKHLRESLDAIIESCVNTVGVDLNTASVPLLRHVSGLNALVAQRLVEWRKQNGPFRRREQLREIPGIGERTFEQAAGFLKIQGGEEPLDTTWIHPESYPVARQILGEMGLEPAILSEKDRLTDMQEKVKALSPAEIANRLQVGVPTVEDILESLARPGRDPREDLPTPVFKKGILKLEDLQPGMELKGTVLNVVDFGAFIDIGLKDSGLVHISQMANRFVKSPYDLVSVGDVVQVWVMAVDNQRHRVSLTMISPGTERKPAEKRAPGPRRERREHPQPQGVDGVPNQAQGERGGRPPRPPRGPRPEGPRGPRQGDNTSAQQGERPPREGGGRPPREGERAPRGQRRDGPPRGAPQGTGAGKPRSTLPPRGTSRIGANAAQSRQQRKGPTPPLPGAETPPVDSVAQETPATPPTPQRKPQSRPRAQSPRLSKEALTGKEPLSSFSQLAALLEARQNKPSETAESSTPVVDQDVSKASGPESASDPGEK